MGALGLISLTEVGSTPTPAFMKTYKLPEPLTVSDCIVDQITLQEYASGGLAITAECQFEDDPSLHEPFATLSVNIPDQISLLGPDEFFFKNYSENEAVFKAFVDAGYVELSGKVAHTGYVTVPVCKLTQKAISQPL